jgi:hypothetical protein
MAFLTKKLFVRSGKGRIQSRIILGVFDKNAYLFLQNEYFRGRKYQIYRDRSLPVLVAGNPLRMPYSGETELITKTVIYNFFSNLWLIFFATLILSLSLLRISIFFTGRYLVSSLQC